MACQSAKKSILSSAKRGSVARQPRYLSHDRHFRQSFVPCCRPLLLTGYLSYYSIVISAVNATHRALLRQGDTTSVAAGPFNKLTDLAIQVEDKTTFPIEYSTSLGMYFFLRNTEMFHSSPNLFWKIRCWSFLNPLDRIYDTIFSSHALENRVLLFHMVIGFR